jgi:hypothetical protein
VLVYDFLKVYNENGSFRKILRRLLTGIPFVVTGCFHGDSLID